MPNLIDLTGQRFGRWTVIEKAKRDPSKKGFGVRWICRCDCGTIKEVQGQMLREGTSISCGCFRIETIQNRAAKKRTEKSILSDLVGERFGKWTVVDFGGYVEKTYKRNGADFVSRYSTWVCKCDCGEVRTVRESALKKGESKSCGCLRNDLGKEAHARQLEERTFVSLGGSPTPSQMVSVVLGISDSSDLTKEQLEAAVTSMFPFWWNRAVRGEMRTKRQHYPELILDHCEICGVSCKPEWHHIVPVSKYGGNEKENIINLCHDCHQKVERGLLSI